MSLDKKLLEILVCPKCKGSLEYKLTEKEEILTCPDCQLFYPIKDGIPVMLVEKVIKQY